MRVLKESQSRGISSSVVDSRESDDIFWARLPDPSKRFVREQFGRNECRELIAAKLLDHTIPPTFVAALCKLSKPMFYILLATLVVYAKSESTMSASLHRHHISILSKTYQR